MSKFLSSLIDSKIAVYCKTKEIAKSFLQYCSDNGVRFLSNASIDTNKLLWDEQNDSVYYTLSRCFHYDLNSYIGLNAVPFECLKEDCYKFINYTKE